MSKFEASAEELFALSSAYRAIGRRIEADLEELTSRTARLRNDWIGSKSISFQKVANEIESSREELHSALEQMAKLLRSASEAYSSAEQNVRNAFDA